jgi:hypothetical protein
VNYLPGGFSMRRIYLIAVIVIMTAFTFYVRAGIEPAPTGPQEGPAVAHTTRGAYANCLTCHANVRETHARFGDFEDCSVCHVYPMETPHAVAGAFADCMRCHGEITESHDEMFASYDNCLTCHEVE